MRDSGYLVDARLETPSLQSSVPPALFPKLTDALESRRYFARAVTLPISLRLMIFLYYYDGNMHLVKKEVSEKATPPREVLPTRHPVLLEPALFSGYPKTFYCDPLYSCCVLLEEASYDPF